ncbi:ABC-three component system middle component 2 [Photobacterium chitinilyticum]|uniref:Threonine transporter n=1 Tax=Photobacterium chitinilyticum TaxID=2485123 RepID=A0A444JP73_9GAMM|nr:ABC-three component system middle component 2 [Photobacterium chitinilyticum]RWX54859.1 hypothetical protein EDI28_14025 [Photobacterium chitinilyticum]
MTSEMTFSLAYNNQLEFGLRALVILSHVYPHECDLEKLSYLDYIIVHSGDFNEYLKSIHAPIPYRSTEVLVRREQMKRGINLLCNYGLAMPVFLEKGFYYRISEEGVPFLDSLAEAYVKYVDERASWAVREFGKYSSSELSNLICEANIDGDAEIVFQTGVLV